MVEDSLTSILYIAHLPRNFQEKELKELFRQFSTIKNIQVSRAENGNSRCYGWVELDSVETAKIAQDALDRYFLDEKQLTVKQLRQSEVPEKLFTNARRGPKKKVYPQLNKRDSVMKFARKEKELMAKLSERGITYTWDSFISKLEKMNIKIEE